MAAQAQRLFHAYPWLQAPVLVSAPMRLIAEAELAVEVSKAGSFGFLGAGSDVSTLDAMFADAERLLKNSALPTRQNCMPIGVGFLNWGVSLDSVLPTLVKYKPAAVWCFAPKCTSDLESWCNEVKSATQGAVKIWIQIGTVAEALQVAKYDVDVLVVQGSDAGGHGLNDCASLMTLLPEVADALTAAPDLTDRQAPVLVAAGGIMDGRGVAATIGPLGASGAVLGTRLLAAHEANITEGYRAALLEARDGGTNTVRSSVYDNLRGTTHWPARYGGRGVINRSWEDHLNGLSLEQNLRLYREAESQGDKGWGSEGRMTTYAGTGVGLLSKMQPAKDIIEEVRDQAKQILQHKHVFTA